MLSAAGSAAGELVGCAIFNAKNEAGCNSFTVGGVVAVPANTLHSAENPSCTPLRAMQALSGGVRLVASELCCIAVMVTSEPKLVKPSL